MPNYADYTITNSVVLYVTTRIQYTRKIQETGLPDGGSSKGAPPPASMPEAKGDKGEEDNESGKAGWTAR